ncbi:dimethylsulfonioproprionate lyase family protein [Salaquimonas pukyongi]|uniref:dimethylsulfonioproprionate lyase family protein n=1 Tax=Salaquimonas pukyongi TaxID=2712698 RepID=UPI00096B6C53|nr:dimethylsulfonioproprionate lyase family protein [Salaquimonas pukyongi]
MSIKPLFDSFRDYLSLRDEPVAREWLDGFDWCLSERNLAPRHVTASRHLDAAADHAGRAEGALLARFSEFAGQLHWKQMYTAEDFGQDFLDNYAHVELIGPEGHFMSEEIAAGLVVYGPGLDYPEHWHVAEEIYIPLTHDGLWSADGAPLAPRKAGSFIFHESNMRHAIRAGSATLVALWVWRNGDLRQKADY